MTLKLPPQHAHSHTVTKDTVDLLIRQFNECATILSSVRLRPSDEHLRKGKPLSSLQPCTKSDRDQGEILAGIRKSLRPSAQHRSLMEQYHNHGQHEGHCRIEKHD